MAKKQEERVNDVLEELLEAAYTKEHEEMAFQVARTLQEVIEMEELTANKSVSEWFKLARNNKGIITVVINSFLREQRVSRNQFFDLRKQFWQEIREYEEINKDEDREQKEDNILDNL